MKQAVVLGKKSERLLQCSKRKNYESRESSRIDWRRSARFVVFSRDRACSDSFAARQGSAKREAGSPR
ncbi:MAG: hypothetical protein [Olavius algarvensis Gamma 1 endosymbiont]|nr:MAG: hypothetical protein [Olavius algarvensis Gamma 1 endosymbiont]